MSCPSVSVFRSGAVGIRWDEPAITYAALLGGAGGDSAPPLDRAQLRKVQQGLALPVTGYTLQVVMCADDGGRALPEQALQAAREASEGGAGGGTQGHGAGALRQLSGRRTAQHTHAPAQPESDADEGSGVTSLAMLPGDNGHITVRGTVIATRRVPASAQGKLTLSDTLLLGGVYRVRAAASNALGTGGWSPLTPPLVVAKPPSRCPPPQALVLGISPPVAPRQGDGFTPTASLSEAWAQDSHLQVGEVVPVDPEGPLAPLAGEMASIRLEHRQRDSDLQGTGGDGTTESKCLTDVTAGSGPISVTSGRTDVTACVVVHWLAALGMSAGQVCTPSLYQQGASKSAHQCASVQRSDGDSPPEEGRFLDGGSEVQAWEVAVWGTPPVPPRAKSVFKRLASSQRSGGAAAAAPRQLVARHRLHGELFFAALLGCRVGWTYAVAVSAINRCGPGPTSAPLVVRVPHTLHPLPPPSCLPNAGGGEDAAEGGGTEAQDDAPADEDHVPTPVAVPIEPSFSTPAEAQSLEQAESRGGLSKPEGPSAGSAFSGRPVADVLAEDFGSTWGGGDTAASDMELQAGWLGGGAAGPSHVKALSPVNASPTESDAPRQTAVQSYELQTGGVDGHVAQGGDSAGSPSHWLEAYSSQAEAAAGAAAASSVEGVGGGRHSFGASGSEADFF